MPGEVRARRHTPTRRFLRCFARHRLGVIGLGVLTLIIPAAIGAPYLAGHDPNAPNLELINAPPSWEHILGYDDLGRDIWSPIL